MFRSCYTQDNQSLNRTFYIHPCLVLINIRVRLKKGNNMKLTRQLVISFFVFSSCAVASTTEIQNVEAKNIFGTWICGISLEEEGVELRLDYEASYIRNGRSNGFGELSIKFSPEIPKIVYLLSISGTWEIMGKYLVETAIDVKLVKLSGNLPERMPKIENMFPKNISASSEIIAISENSITLKSESDGQVVSCKRKPKKTNK